MLGPARQSAILKAVTARGSCTVSELARELDVSGETIRRDIRVMARQGLVRKVHGGVSVPDQLRESSFRQRLLENAEAKQAIARLAAAQVQNGDSLMMDTGSTTAYIARELVDHRDLMLITNCTEIARTLARGNGNRVFLVGGELRGDDGALFGGEAVRFIERFRCRVALLSIGGVDLDSGFMDFHPEEAEFSQAVIAQASRVVVAADHSKFGRQATVKVCDLAGVDALITDQPPPAPFARRLAEVQVEIVSPAG
ncbi:MAG: DeoR/GlpR family DNA-binding transcription regulator [Kiloniellales bacterium]|nr:DeoR/GlpR family DNA-binding transcription regulator [Kiloniellales bacterium]